MWIDRRILFAVTAASLLLNVFLGGAVLGRLFGEHRGAGGPAKIQGGPLVRPANVQALPPEERRLFRQAMAPHRPLIKAAREAHREARRQVEADIADPTFDRAKLEADFQALRRSNQDADQALDDALIAALPTLKPASRAALVAHVRAEPSAAGSSAANSSAANSSAAKPRP